MIGPLNTYKVIKISKIATYWQGHGTSETLMLVEMQMVQSLWKAVWWYSYKVKHTLTINPSNPTFRYLSKNYVDTKICM